MIERCLGDAPAARVLVPARARAQPALLCPLVARRRGGTHHETARCSSLVAAAALAGPAAASAHPLGNFTVNHFAASRSPATGSTSATSSISPRSRRSRPATRRRRERYARRIARGLEVTVDGRPRARSSRSAHALAFPRGAGGLHTMRFEVILRGPRSTRPRAARARTTRTTPAASAGRRSSSARRTPSVSRRAARVPEEPAREPAGRDHITRDARRRRRRPRRR